MAFYEGQCDCGIVAVCFESAQALSDLIPRRCDCDFCQEHSAFWISEPQARLDSHVKKTKPLRSVGQGSGQVCFRFCPHCDRLVCATVDIDAVRYGVVNGAVLSTFADFPAAVSVSPRYLSAAEKRARWQKNWMSHITGCKG